LDEEINNVNLKTIIVVSTPLLIVFLVGVHSAYADVNLGKIVITPIPLTKFNILAVEYSTGCSTALKHNVTTSCPTLDKIWKYDTSNTKISGKLLLSNGVFSRSEPQVKNHFQWYGGMPMVVCIDCKVDLARPGIVKTIYLESSDFIYIDKTQEVKNSHTVYSYQKRSVTPDCYSATIAYNDTLLSDTIKYLLSNCSITSFNGTMSSSIKQTPSDFKDCISCNQKAYDDASLKIVKAQNCIIHICKTPTDPFKKAAWGK
jgi:hypothetical protein